MLPISFVFEVLKPDRLSDVNDLQPTNIEFILVTFDVSKPDKSRVWSFEQPENIHSIFFTFEVLNEDRLTNINDEQS